MHIIEWDSLHDATITHIAIDWKQGHLEIDIVTSANNPDRRSYKAKINAKDFYHFTCSRKFPWGGTIECDINVVYGPRKMDEDGSHIQFELQSGDLLTIEAKELTIDAIELYAQY